MNELHLMLLVAVVITIVVLLYEYCWLTPHVWEWQHNEERRLLEVPRFMKQRSQPWKTIGRYRCRRCREWSDGCARHEQASRVVGAFDQQLEREDAQRGGL